MIPTKGKGCASGERPLGRLLSMQNVGHLRPASGVWRTWKVKTVSHWRRP